MFRVALLALLAAAAAGLGMYGARVNKHAAYEQFVSNLIDDLLQPAEGYEEVINKTKKTNPKYKALTMQSRDQLRGLKRMIETIVDQNLSGDVYETGVWRGGTGIFMVSVFQAYERLRGKADLGRHYYFFDSFEGYPNMTSDPFLDRYLNDPVFAAPLAIVKESFQKYGVLLPDKVFFVKGWLEDTVPNFTAPRQIAILRMDADLYPATMVVLDHLYRRVQTGGWAIVDSYYWRPKGTANSTKLCREAVDKYRYNILSPLTLAYGSPSWQKDAFEVYEQFVSNLIDDLQQPPEEYEDVIKKTRKTDTLTSHLHDPKYHHSNDQYKRLTHQSKDQLRGLKRMIETIVDQNLSGDVYETGVWRGGTGIFMVSVFQAYERLRDKADLGRQYYFFDIFEDGGFPNVPNDPWLDRYWDESVFAAPLSLVKKSFQRYGVLLPNKVFFVKGWLEDTVPNFTAPRQIAILRMDTNLYSGQKVVLDHLYPRVQAGGFAMVDNYEFRPEGAANSTKLAREAIDEYRSAHGITAPVTETYGSHSWQKDAPAGETLLSITRWRRNVNRLNSVGSFVAAPV